MRNSDSVSNDRILNLRSVAAAVCLVFVALGGARAQTASPFKDADKLWTTIGSGGTVEKNDIGKIFFNHAVVQMGSLPVNQPGAGWNVTKRAAITQPSESAIIRYNVTAVDGLFFQTRPCGGGADCLGPGLTLRFLDNGSRARVFARLVEVDMATGLENYPLTFDSNSFPPSNNYQLQHQGACGQILRFDFRNKAYYIEAVLTTGITVGSAAGIQAINIDARRCIG